MSGQRFAALGGPEVRHWLQPKTWSGGSHRARFEAIRPWVEGKRVLDLGAASGHAREDWMHASLRSVAAEVIGVDLDKHAVDVISGKGHSSVVFGDAETLDLGGEFDVVHAGELIEHLEDFRSFLAAVRKHVRPGGMLVLTTPNAFAVANFVYRFGGTPRVNRDHTCWFCEDTIRQLLERNDYDVVHIGYVPHETPGRFRAAAAAGVRALVPERLKWDTLFVVAVPRIT